MRTQVAVVLGEPRLEDVGLRVEVLQLGVQRGVRPGLRTQGEPQPVQRPAGLREPVGQRVRPGLAQQVLRREPGLGQGSVPAQRHVRLPGLEQLVLVPVEAVDGGDGVAGQEPVLQLDRGTTPCASSQSAARRCRAASAGPAGREVAQRSRQQRMPFEPRPLLGEGPHREAQQAHPVTRASTAPAPPTRRPRRRARVQLVEDRGVEQQVVGRPAPTRSSQARSASSAPWVRSQVSTSAGAVRVGTLCGRAERRRPAVAQGDDLSARSPSSRSGTRAARSRARDSSGPRRRSSPSSSATRPGLPEPGEGGSQGGRGRHRHAAGRRAVASRARRGGEGASSCSNGVDVEHHQPGRLLASRRGRLLGVGVAGTHRPVAPATSDLDSRGRKRDGGGLLAEREVDDGATAVPGLRQQQAGATRGRRPDQLHEAGPRQGSRRGLARVVRHPPHASAR